MGTSEPARQFLMILFRDLDNPSFMRLARSPEFSTYLTLRRYIWRSNQRHSRNLHLRWYARGYLCCGLSRKAIAHRIGNDIQERTVTNDIARLVQCRVVELAGARERRVLAALQRVGRWGIAGGAVVEHYYLERLTSGSDPCAQSIGEDGESAPACAPALTPMAKSFHSLGKETATINRELLNTKGIRRNDPPQKSDSEIWKAVLDELRLQLVRGRV